TNDLRSSPCLLATFLTEPRLSPLGPALYGLARSPGGGDFFELASPHIIDVPVDRNGPGNQRMTADALHISDDPSRVILHREPIDELTFRRSRTLPDIAKPVRSEFCCLEAAGKEAPHHLVSEEQHAAVGVVDDEKLPGGQQFVRDDQGT